jgi:hypothetical protein
MPKSTNRTNSKLSLPKQSIPPPAPSSSPSSPSMIDSMKQGFSFGVGSSIAHNVINATFNSKNKDETVNTKDITNETKLTSEKIYELYNKCLEKNDNNIDCTIILQNNK